MLWQRLRGSPGGLRFRRQHPMGLYVLDFYCSNRALVVEGDGFAHQLAAQARHDAERDAWLTAQGMTILRVPATDVLADIDAVVETVLATANSLSARS